MTDNLHKSQIRKNKRQAGQGLIEYGLLILLVGVASIVLVNLFQDELKDVFRDFAGSNDLAPPDIGPIGGEFTPRPATATPIPIAPQITAFRSNPISPIQVISNTYPISIDFIVTATDENNDIKSYELDIGGTGGSFGTADETWYPGETPPSHSFAAKGTYTFYLRVTDDTNLTAEASTTIVVYESTDELVDIAPNIQSIPVDNMIVTVGDSVTFSSVIEFDTDSSAETSTYRWVMGDGNIRSGSPLTYTYSAAGTYSVFLQVTDSDGLMDTSETITITVNPPPTPEPTPTETPTITPTPDCLTDIGGAIPSGTIPGTIQMEDFDCGGEGVGYSDKDTSNTGGQYRTSEGVEIPSSGKRVRRLPRRYRWCYRMDGLHGKCT